jgi:hypothetical protein
MAQIRKEKLYGLVFAHVEMLLMSMELALEMAALKAVDA